MNAHLRNLLAMLQNNGGKVVAYEDDAAEMFDHAAVTEALQLRLITYTGDGADGVCDGYKLTRKGWAALGVERPSLFARIKGVLLKAA